MAATTLVRKFLEQVCTTLQDISPQYRLWPERELVGYVNWGQTAIAKYVPICGARLDAVRLQPGAVQNLTKVLAANIRPGDGSTAADVYGLAVRSLVCNMGVSGLTTGRAIRPPVDQHTLAAGNPNWIAGTADTTVREWVALAGQPLSFLVNPPVHGTTAVWVLVDWMVSPARVADGGAPGAETYLAGGASTAVLGIDDRWTDDLHHYVVAAALTKLGKNTENLQRAAMHAQAFTGSINAQAAAITGVDPKLKALPFLSQLQANA